MDLKLFTALPFSMADTIAMFGLSQEDLNLKILHAQAGSSVFAAQMHQLNHSVVACDNLYKKPLEEIKTQVLSAIEFVEQDLIHHPYQYAHESQAKQFIGESKKNVDHFLKDFEVGLKEGRYQAGTLSKLPYQNEQFELALLSHYLFTQTISLSLEDHVQAILELTRVANEVRIFPLVTDKAALSSHLGNVIAKLQSGGLNEEIRMVPFELQKKGNAMLRVWSKACSLDAHQP